MAIPEGVPPLSRCVDLQLLGSYSTRLTLISSFTPARCQLLPLTNHCRANYPAWLKLILPTDNGDKCLSLIALF